MKSKGLFACMALVLALGACKTGSRAPQSPLSLRAADQVAVVDGKPVTYGEVEKEQGGKLVQAEIKALTELYDVRRNAVEQYVTKRLLEDEAKAKGQTLEQWFDKDLLGMVAAPTDEEMKKFYEQNKAQMGGQAYDQIKDRIATYLKQQKGRDQLAKVVEDLKAKHGVQITLAQPNLPRVEVAATGPSRGPASAPVTIVEFSDFQCPYCGREYPVVERLMKEYEGKVRLVFRHFPLDFHPFAQKAAEAGACAADQGGDKFWKLHDGMFTNGAVPYEQFKDAVDRELKRKG